MWLWTWGLALANEPAVEPIDARRRAEAVDFAVVRDAILAGGARQTYGNRFNHNPYARFGEVDAYLDPADAGNTDCDPARSGFDAIVVYRAAAEPRWLTLRLGADGGLVVVPPEAQEAARAALRAMAAQAGG